MDHVSVVDDDLAAIAFFTALGKSREPLGKIVTRLHAALIDSSAQDLMIENALAIQP